nr:hypothetical protein NQZ09_pgp005 [Fibrocapsa japonica]UTE95087.1 hypothetical protein FjapPt_p005 [Fibrocapsa japonica]
MAIQLFIFTTRKLGKTLFLKNKLKNFYLPGNLLKDKSTIY